MAMAPNACRTRGRRSWCRCVQMEEEEEEEDEKGVHSADLVPCRTRYAKLYRAAPPRCLASLRISILIHLDPNAFYSDSPLQKSHESSTQKVADPVSNLIWNAGQVQKFVGHTRRSIPQPFPSPIHMQGRQPPIPIKIHRKDSIRDDWSSILYNPRFRMTLRLSPPPSSHAISKPSRNGRAQFSSP